MAGELRVKEPREFLGGDPKDHLRELAQSVRRLIRGGHNSFYIVEAVAGTTETEVEVADAATGGVALVGPGSAAAAALCAGAEVWASVESGRVVVRHPAWGADATLVVIVAG